MDSQKVMKAPLLATGGANKISGVPRTKAVCPKANVMSVTVMLVVLDGDKLVMHGAAQAGDKREAGLGAKKIQVPGVKKETALGVKKIQALGDKREVVLGAKKMQALGGKREVRHGVKKMRALGDKQQVQMEVLGARQEGMMDGGNRVISKAKNILLINLNMRGNKEIGMVSTHTVIKCNKAITKCKANRAIVYRGMYKIIIKVIHAMAILSMAIQQCGTVTKRKAKINGVKRMRLRMRTMAGEQKVVHGVQNRMIGV